MRRVVAGAVVVAGLLFASLFASSSQAAIHPITVGWVCGNASGNPPGPTPGENHSNHWTFRAIQCAGLLTITSSGPVRDTTVPASKFSTFDPVTETGTPS